MMRRFSVIGIRAPVKTTSFFGDNHTPTQPTNASNKRLVLPLAIVFLIFFTIFSLLRVYLVFDFSSITTSKLDVSVEDSSNSTSTSNQTKRVISRDTRTQPTGICDREGSEELRFCTLRALLRGNETVSRRLEDNTEYYISTCTIVKDDGDLLHEFIVRNFLAGVDHFFIYDDNGENAFEDLTKLLRPFSPLVTIITPPENDELLEMINRPGASLLGSQNPQHMMLWHCFLKYGSMSRWILPANANEFVEAKHPHDLEQDGLRYEYIPFMRKFLGDIEDRVPAQIGRRNTVLTNSVVEPPSLEKISLHDKYPTACGRKDVANHLADFDILFAAKTAVQPRYVDYEHYRKVGDFFQDGLNHSYVNGTVPKDLFFSEPYTEYTLPVNPTESQWTIVHYWSRSFGDYLLKEERRRPNVNLTRDVQELIQRETACKLHGSAMIPPGTDRRNGVVKQLLKEVDGFQEVQRTYYDAAQKALKAKELLPLIMEYKKQMESNIFRAT